jgi:hypothetical protein
MLKKIIIMTTVTVNLCLANCNMRLLSQYSSILENRIWEGAITEQDIVDRLDFMYKPIGNDVGRDFSAIKLEYDHIKGVSSAFDSFICYSEKIYDIGDERTKLSVTRLFEETAKKYTLTLHKIEQAKKIPYTYSVSTSDMTSFLTFDKSRPLISF